MMGRLKIGSVLISFALVLFFSVGWAQTVDRNEVIRELGEPVLFGEIYNIQIQAHGSPFFNPEWASGNIYLSNGGVAKNKMIRYNGLTDELFWFDTGKNNTIILDKAAVKGFSIKDSLTGETLYFQRLKLRLPFASGKAEAFVQVLHEGNFSLYVLRRIEEDGKQVVFRNNRRVELPFLKAKPLYYVGLPGQTIRQGQMDGKGRAGMPETDLVEVQRMRKSFFYGLMPGERDAIRRALSNHPFWIRGEKALIELVKDLDKI